MMRQVVVEFFAEVACRLVPGSILGHVPSIERQRFLLFVASRTESEVFLRLW